MLLECLNYRKFVYIGKEIVAVTCADGKVVPGNTDRTFVDIVNLAGLNNVCAVNAHKLWLRQMLLNGFHCHECHYGALVLDMQFQVVLYTLYIQELAYFHLYQTVFALDVEELVHSHLLILFHSFYLLILLYMFIRISMPLWGRDVQPYGQE